MVGSPAGRRG